MARSAPARRGPLVALAATLLALALAELGTRLSGVADGVLPDAPYGQADLDALLQWQAGLGQRGVVFAGQAHDSQLGWVSAPSLRDFVEPGHPPRSTNSAGMRGAAEFPLEPTPGRLRIATIGDSFTFGTHQPDARIWPARLAEAIGEQGGPQVEVLNFGVPGFGTDQALLRLERDVLSYRPDVVVWGIFETNPQRSRRHFSFYAKPRFDLRGAELHLAHVPVPSPEELRDAQWGRAARVGDVHLLRWLRIARGGPLGPGTAGLVELHEALLTRAARSCEAAGAKLLVVPIPTLRFQELEPSATELSTHALAAGDLLASFDLRAIFDAASAGPSPPIYIPGRHFSPEGHWLVAHGIAGRLSQLDWLDAPPAGD